MLKMIRVYGFAVSLNSQMKIVGVQYHETLVCLLYVHLCVHAAATTAIIIMIMKMSYRAPFPNA